MFVKIDENEIWHQPPGPDFQLRSENYGPYVWDVFLALSGGEEVDITGIEDDIISQIVGNIQKNGTLENEYEENTKFAKRIIRRIWAHESGSVIHILRQHRAALVAVGVLSG